MQLINITDLSEFIVQTVTDSWLRKEARGTIVYMLRYDHK